MNGKYNGYGVYGNLNKKIFEGNFLDDKFIEGTIYYYDNILDHYEGSVLYD